MDLRKKIWPVLHCSATIGYVVLLFTFIFSSITFITAMGECETLGDRVRGDLQSGDELLTVSSESGDNLAATRTLTPPITGVVPLLNSGWLVLSVVLLISVTGYYLVRKMSVVRNQS